MHPVQSRALLGVGLALLSMAGCQSPPRQPSGSAATPKLRAAVVAFSNKGRSGGEALAGSAIDLLTTSLWQTGRFELVERAEVRRVLQEQRFQTSDLVDPQTAVRVGRLLGAAAIVVGTITEAGVDEGGLGLSGMAGWAGSTAKCTVHVRLIDVQSSRILTSVSSTQTQGGGNLHILGIGGGSSHNPRLLRAALTKAVEEASGKMAAAVKEQS